MKQTINIQHDRHDDILWHNEAGEYDIEVEYFESEPSVSITIQKYDGNHKKSGTMCFGLGDRSTQELIDALQYALKQKKEYNKKFF